MNSIMHCLRFLTVMWHGDCPGSMTWIAVLSSPPSTGHTSFASHICRLTEMESFPPPDTSFLPLRTHTHCAFPQLTMVQPVELSAIGIAPHRVACNMTHRDVLAGCLEFSSPTSGTSDIGLHIGETTSLALVWALWCLLLSLLV